MTQALSASIAKVLIEQSPAHAKWYAEHGIKATEAMDRGTIAHALLLEGENRMAVLDFKDYRTNDAKEARDAARDAGKYPVLTKDVQGIQDMVGAARHAWDTCDDLANYRHADGVVEKSIEWDEKGLLCRARPDWYANDHRVMLDPKFTEASASPERIARQVISMAYDQRAAFYVRGGEALNGIAPSYVFLFQEVDPPYGTAFIGVPPAMLELGMAKATWAIGKWRECLASGVWPSYENRIHWAEPPAWALEQWGVQE